MRKIQLFLQWEGSRKIELIDVDSAGTIEQIVAAAVGAGLPQSHAAEVVVFGPDAETPLDRNAVVDGARIRHRDRVHVHRCHKVDVTLHFNEVTETHPFPPSANVARVKEWFVHRIHMSAVDATEHVLQLCGTTERPNPDDQIGGLVTNCCTLCFDLVPIQRIEG